ncbi:MAG: aminotransferase class I/II-fold pyridoxal phosphate-dependent enzyme [Deltaproteobacteria bacterium]|nr:aminotransferase class I/II-fold pyridoxal phosphate-dependent enzyme [Deltaproteobacteria bacterium]
MKTPRKTALEAAFDPDRFRSEGHALIDQLADYLTRALERRTRQVLPWVPPEVQVASTPGFSEEPEADLASLVDDLLGRSLALHDPRCMGHQDGVPTPTACLTELVTGLVNNDPSCYESAPFAVAMEQKLLRWFLDEVGYSEDADGVFTSGGSLGNVTALLAARQAKAGFDAWKRGDAEETKLCVLVSEETHYCVARAVQIMGWGEDGYVKVPVDSSFHLDPAALPAALEEARRRGRKPIAIVASAGTTATGAFDPLPEIADFCEANDLWLHVDGAHGGSTVLSPSYRHLVAGIERADSVVWDAHKMMMIPALLSAVLFKDGRHSYETFRQEATYLFEGRPDEEWYNAGNRTVECTRPAMSTRLYLSLRAQGIAPFREYVTRCFDLGRRFAKLIDRSDDFELAVAPEANIICFRHTPAGAPDLDALQDRIRREVVESGDYYLVSAEILGALWLRCTIMNPFTEDEDLQRLLDLLRDAAAQPSRDAD